MFRIAILITILTISLLSPAQNDRSGTLYSTSDGHVSFVSDAPLELISAESHALRGLLDPDDGRFAFQLETRSLTGFNSPLQQEHFYENYIETEKYPIASFTGKIIEEIDFSKPGILDVRAKGILDIHGVKKERIIKCTLEIEPGKFTANSVFGVILDDHDISIPKLVYQKIAEEVRVTIDAVLTRQKDPSE